MSWSIAPTADLPDDADAAAYIAAVEAADTAAGSPGGLEIGVKRAINAFVKGCKADGTWPAIKASCILAGARTLSGALVPLKGAAPTNFNFVSGDYNRKTGLVGDGSTKYLDSNRNNNADPQNNKHLALVKTKNTSIAGFLLGTITAGVNGSWIYESDGALNDTYRINSSSSTAFASGTYPDTGFIGCSRLASGATTIRYKNVTASHDLASASPAVETIRVINSDARLAFYSIGESLDLALLDARVTTLVNTLSSVIP